MKKSFSNIEFYAPDNFHRWGAPPPTQKTGYSGQRAYINLLELARM